MDIYISVSPPNKYNSLLFFSHFFSLNIGKSQQLNILTIIYRFKTTKLKHPSKRKFTVEKHMNIHHKTVAFYEIGSFKNLKSVSKCRNWLIFIKITYLLI